MKNTCIQVGQAGLVQCIQFLVVFIKVGVNKFYA